MDRQLLRARGVRREEVLTEEEFLLVYRESVDPGARESVGREIFHLLDIMCEGFVTCEEFIAVLEELGGGEIAELRKRISEGDSGGIPEWGSGETSPPGLRGDSG